MTKKIFITSLAALGITLFFLVIYNFVFKKDYSKDAESLSKNDKDEELLLKKNNKSEALTMVSEDKIIRAVFVRNTERVRYYATDGTVWEAESDGSNKKQISDKKLEGINNIYWSPDGSRVITSFNKNGIAEFFTYDYQTNKGIKLKENLDNVVWDSIGAKIIYKYFDRSSQKRTLNVANPDGSDWKPVADVPFRDIAVSPVPQSSLVSFWNMPTSMDETNLFVAGISGGDVKKIFSGKFGADYLWSWNGENALVSSLNEKNGKKITLGVIDRAGSYYDLNIPTFASKCIWSADNKTVYYALPASIPENSFLPDDYINRKFYSADTFWKVDIKTGKKERVAELDDIDEKYDASKLFLSEGESELFFINRTDRKLYKIKL